MRPGYGACMLQAHNAPGGNGWLGPWVDFASARAGKELSCRRLMKCQQQQQRPTAQQWYATYIRTVVDCLLWAWGCCETRAGQWGCVGGGGGGGGGGFGGLLVRLQEWYVSHHKAVAAGGGGR